MNATHFYFPPVMIRYSKALILWMLFITTFFSFKAYSFNLVLDENVNFNHEGTKSYLKSNANSRKDIEGVVSDATTGRPLAGVTVRIKGGNIGTITDENGHYNIDVPDNAILVFSSLGYSSRDIPVNGKLKIDVALESSSKAMSEVVVIGYGSRQKKDVTGAISTIDASDIEKSTAMSPELAMQGRMAGVSVTSGGGDPSARPIIRIRGVNTFNDANPLYVVDGVPIVEGGTGISTDVTVADLRTPINIFSLINPNNIASISVLKDASAAAVYGVRAANGVILITTKKGKSGRARVSLDASMGIQNVPQTINVLNTKQYLDLYQDAYSNNPTLDANTGQPVSIGKSTFGPTYDPSSPQYLGNAPFYNWQKALLNKNASVNNYNINVSGGSNSTNYFFSAGYSYVEGALKQNNQERYTVTTNIHSDVNKVVSMGLNLHLTNENTLKNTKGDLHIYKAPPWQPIYDQSGLGGFASVMQGSFKPNPSYDPTKLSPGPKYVFDGNPVGLWGPQQVSNALAVQNFSRLTYNNQMLIGNAFIQLEPINGLKIKGSISGNVYHIKSENWGDYRGWIFSQTPGNPYNGQDGTAAGSLAIRNTQTNNLITALNIDYSHLFGKHSIDLMIDASKQSYRWKITSASSGQVNYLDPSLRYFDAILPFAKGFYVEKQNNALIGYLGRLSYKYNNEYYLDITVRRDGSSRFAPGNQWGTFPSVSGAWRITNNDFMKKLKWLNDLKIRGGFGSLGNEQTTAGYAFLSIARLTPHYAVGSGNGDGQGSMQIGSYLPTMPNTSLTWEKVHTTNIGFDALMFNNSLSFSIDYYHKTTRGIIQSVSLPANVGISDPIDQNVADVLNTGFEFQANYTKEIGKLTFSLSSNLTTVHNKILSLYNHIPIRSAGLEEGYPIGYIYGYKMGGIFQDDKQVDDWKAKYKDGIGANDPKPGDIYFKDVYGNPQPGQVTHNMHTDSVINFNDQTYLGSTIPKFYYGFNVKLLYKNFDLSIFFQGVGDVKKYNWLRAEGESMSSNGINQWASVLNRWTPNHKSSNMPRAIFADPNKNTRQSDRFVESAAYLRLQNVQFGYTIPSTVLSRQNIINNIRLYISGVNLMTITKWTGIDPENDLIPSTRQFIAGININF